MVFTASQPFTATLVTSNINEFRHEWIWIKDKGSNFANTVREPFKEHESVLVFSRGKWTYNKQMQDRAPSGSERAAYGVSWVTKSSNYREFENRPGARSLAKQRVPSSHQKFGVERGLHPTQKPVALMQYMVRTYTNPGETVLDCCMGSGTTMVASLKEDRKCIGIESDPVYFETAVKRVKGELSKMLLF
jgi:site-specific DNA-methyltransferase (adenine-specific)